MQDKNPELVKGNFVRVTGKLKTDFYLSREGKPTGTLLIIAFEASKIAMPAQGNDEAKDTVSEVVPAKATVEAPEPARVTASTGLRIFSSASLASMARSRVSKTLSKAL